MSASQIQKARKETTRAAPVFQLLPKDATLRAELDSHLAALRREGLIASFTIG